MHHNIITFVVGSVLHESDPTQHISSYVYFGYKATVCLTVFATEQERHEKRVTMQLTMLVESHGLESMLHHFYNLGNHQRHAI